MFQTKVIANSVLGKHSVNACLPLGSQPIRSSTPEHPAAPSWSTTRSPPTA
ncbi:hypothetical protein [Streptomyces sp. NPDC059788]|uniref:hypothetical protein n=1 Tax=Streptomyces sp. NPDC059788 TaxID=3346948 RepID=UPI0036471209